MSEAVRLQKFLSRAGRASRREAERLIASGRVSVNGVVVRELGTRVVPGVDVVVVDGERVEPEAPVWVAFHKPAGLLTTRRDPHGGRTIYDALPEAYRTLRYVGRLDRNTEGLLILTNDGDAVHGLTHPSRGVEREYVVTLDRPATPETVRRLTVGVELHDGPARASEASFHPDDPTGRTVRMVLTEGRKREVRRMIRAVGHRVVRLVRVRYGPLELGDLPEGAWRELAPMEIAALLSAAGVQRESTREPWT